MATRTRKPDLSAAPSPAEHEAFMRQALELARKGEGRTSPNPMVGAVLVKSGRVIGRGWHQAAGEPHAEIEALQDARARRRGVRDATLYVTLEPCSTRGRTPPCTEAIVQAKLARVVVGAVDPNPAHAGRGLELLAQAGLEVVRGVLAEEAAALNPAFNHWIVERTPWVTVKAAMTLDGKIATAGGESKWITGPEARRVAMGLRRQADAILVGVETVLVDDPQLTVRMEDPEGGARAVCPRRIILDSRARTPLTSKVVSDEWAARTTIVVTRSAPSDQVEALKGKAQVWVAPARRGRIDLRWLFRELGREEVTSLLVEGGGEVLASVLMERWAHRVAFFYAPKVLGGHRARKAVAGQGAGSLDKAIRLRKVTWQRCDPDLLMLAEVVPAVRWPRPPRGERSAGPRHPSHPLPAPLRAKRKSTQPGAAV